MKMNSAQIQQTLHTLNAAELNAEAIPAEHPMMSQLERLFGEHTYILDGRRPQHRGTRRSRTRRRPVGCRGEPRELTTKNSKSVKP